MNHPKVTICIPTYNRAKHLSNCLNSIYQNIEFEFNDLQICVSDNCSTDNTKEIVELAKKKMPITYHRNESNLGIPKNFLKVVDMAAGEYIWLLGDDDLVTQDGIKRLLDLLNKNPSIDFFYVNSFHLDSDFVMGFDQPFKLENLPSSMDKFSDWEVEGELPFMELINPKISFDFLGGMFLSVFRKKNWSLNTNHLDQLALKDNRIFSNFDNTFPHVKIFAKAFANSKAFFVKKPLGINLFGEREWSPMEPLVRNVRLIEALEEYRSNGLSTYAFLRCKNYSLANFIPGIVYMFLNKNISGYAYISPFKLILKNCMYPMFYLSPLLFIFRRTKHFLRSLQEYIKKRNEI